MTKILAAIADITERHAKPLEKRFRGGFEPGKPDACWEWSGAIQAKPDNYGYIKVMRNNLLAHRLAWFFANGEIPDGMCVLHSCDNPPCVNPTHLFLGTRIDNAADRDRKGRNKVKIGIHNPRATFSEAQVLEIRQLAAAGVRQFEIARKMRRNKYVISDIVRRKSWKHL